MYFIEVDGQIRVTEEQLVGFICNFASLLIAVPGHPEQGPFYLIKGLLKVVSEYSWYETLFIFCTYFFKGKHLYLKLEFIFNYCQCFLHIIKLVFLIM